MGIIMDFNVSLEKKNEMMMGRRKYKVRSEGFVRKGILIVSGSERGRDIVYLHFSSTGELRTQ